MFILCQVRVLLLNVLNFELFIILVHDDYCYHHHYYYVNEFCGNIMSILHFVAWACEFELGFGCRMPRLGGESM